MELWWIQNDNFSSDYASMIRLIMDWLEESSHIIEDHIMKHKETEREPIHSLIIMFTKGRSLDQATTLAATIAASLLVS